jgi:chitinase
VFLSLEDETSMLNRLTYIENQGIGGLMIWELAGDYEQKPNGEYGFGSHLTRMAYDHLKAMGPPNTQQTQIEFPDEIGPYKTLFTGNYDHPNYTYQWRIHNLSDQSLQPGWTIEFSLPKTATLTSVWGSQYERLYEHESFYRYRILGPSWQSIPAHGSINLQGMIRLNFSGGPLWVVINNQRAIVDTPEH